jgi:hypothetical protein
MSAELKFRKWLSYVFPPPPITEHMQKYSTVFFSLISLLFFLFLPLPDFNLLRTVGNNEQNVFFSSSGGRKFLIFTYSIEPQGLVNSFLLSQRVSSLKFFYASFKNLVPMSQKEKDQLVNAACCENHMEHINMLCRQNASFFMLKHVDWCIIIKMSD